jgi:antitoxin FitA
MGQLVVRNLDDVVKARLRRRAARHGRSMEEEVREILRNAVESDDRGLEGLGSAFARCFAGIGLDSDIAEIRGTVHPATFDE